MTANDNKSYLPYLNKSADQYNNTYHHSINKKLINADYSASNEKIETNPKATIRIFLVKVILKICQEKYLLLILFWKVILRLINGRI